MSWLITIVATGALSLTGAQAPQTPLDPVALGFQKLTGIAEAPDFESLKTVYRGTSPEDAWRSTDSYARYGDESTYTADVTPDGVARSLHRLRTLIDTGPAFADGAGNAARIRNGLLREIDAYIQRVQADAATGAVPATNRFEGQSFSDGVAVASDTYYFAGGPTQVVLEGRRRTGGDDLIPLFEVEYYATIPQATEFRAVIDRIQAMVTEVQTKPLARLRDRLTEIDQGWTHYLEKGFSQYPWESAINSYVTPHIFTPYTWDSPPRDQLVFLHPELGALLDTRSRSDASAQGTLLVHALGYVHYFGDTRDWFLGGSATLSFSDTDFGLGIGPTFHCGWTRTHSWVPHVSVGVLWHEFDDGDNNPVLAVSLDFWRLLDKDSGQAIFESALRGR